jgi:nucleotide-binding universal stress UspA family protein
VAALDYTNALAAKAGAEIFLLHVSDPAEEERRPLYQSYLEKLAERARQCLGGDQGEAAAAGRVHVVSLVRPLSGQALHYHEVTIEDASNKRVHTLPVMGPTAEQITSYADDEGMDLIVMATHGRSKERPWPVDSVAISVARCATVPVRLVRVARPDQPVCDDWPDQKIVVLLDGSEASEQALPYAIEHARLCGAEINVLRVWEPSPVQDYPGANENLSLEEHRRRALEHGHKETSEYLSRLATRLAQDGISAKIHSLLGDPAEEIVKYVTDRDFDLVIMTTHARCGEGLWPLGSMTDKVLHRTTNPILLVRPK